MISKKSTKDQKIKLLLKGNSSKCGEYAKKMEKYLSVMYIPNAMSLVKDIPGYHMWPNTKGTEEEVHSLKLSGNQRLLFAYDASTELFYNLRFEDPHS